MLIHFLGKGKHRIAITLHYSRLESFLFSPQLFIACLFIFPAVLRTVLKSMFGTVPTLIYLLQATLSARSFGLLDGISV